jgi:hypothetical protein
MLAPGPSSVKYLIYLETRRLTSQLSVSIERLN